MAWWRVATFAKMLDNAIASREDLILVSHAYVDGLRWVDMRREGQYRVS
jgi:hypothetical protein